MLSLRRGGLGWSVVGGTVGILDSTGTSSSCCAVPECCNDAVVWAS